MSLRCATARAPGVPLRISRGCTWSRRLTARAATGGAGSGGGAGGDASPTSGGGRTGSSSSSSSGGGGRSSGSPSGASAVEIEYRGRKLQAPHGTTLRTALLLGGVTPHNGRAALINCRGLGTCGTCAVQVEGPVEPRAWTTAERLRLAFPPHGPPGNARLRLACQVACQGGLRVVKRDGFWGQGKAVLPDLPPPAAGSSGSGGGASVAPLGPLEFVLDRRQRRP